VGPTIPGDPNQWAQAMYNNFMKLHQSLGLDGIDIDLENAWGGTPDKIECGLRTFFSMMTRGGFVVSMAPQTTAITPEVAQYQPGSWNSYVPLADTSIASSVDTVAVQLYNNAVPFNDVGKYAGALTGGFSASGCPCSASCQIKLDPKKNNVRVSSRPRCCSEWVSWTSWWMSVWKSSYQSVQFKFAITKYRRCYDVVSGVG